MVVSISWLPGSQERNVCVNVCAQLQPERHGQIRRHQTLRFPDATRAECFIIQLLHPAILPTYRYNSLNTAFTRLPPVVICSAALAGLSKQPCSISSRFFRELRCFCWFIHQNTQADNLTGPCSNTGLDRSSMQLSLCFSVSSTSLTPTPLHLFLTFW